MICFKFDFKYFITILTISIHLNMQEKLELNKWNNIFKRYLDSAFRQFMMPDSPFQNILRGLKKVTFKLKNSFGL